MQYWAVQKGEDQLKKITEIVIFQNFAMCVQDKYGLNSTYNLYFYIGEKFVHSSGMLKLFAGI